MAKRDGKDFDGDAGSSFVPEPPADEPTDDAVADAPVADEPRFAESVVPDEEAQARYEPLAPPPYIDPVALTEVANEDAQDAAPGADDPNGPVVSHSWGGLQTHNFGGFPYAVGAVVTVDLEKEKLAARKAAEGR